jgi:uncharacterized protein
LHDFFIFAIIGFLAQIVDSSLGMGFGIISNSVLTAQGVSPALVSAAVNAAKLPTTGVSAMAHVFNKNLKREIVVPIAIYGSLGGVLGALLLASLDGAWLKWLITAYLLLLGTLILIKGLKGIAPQLLPSGWTRTIGSIGGIIEGIGGSWGPLVTTALVGSGHDSRYAIGSSNFCEFVVSIAVFVTFVLAHLFGHWDGGADWASVFWPVAGLVAGGLPAAMFGGFVLKLAPRKALITGVGALALGIGLYRAFA